MGNDVGGGRRQALVVLSAIPLAAFAQVPDPRALARFLIKEPLTSALAGDFGVTPDQANAGVGSILVLAQERLSWHDFEKVAAALPGASQYMETARALGALTAPLSDRAGLEAALGGLGMKADAVSKFIPAVTGIVGKAGGARVGALLAEALK